jgi:hypothetical protein
VSRSSLLWVASFILEVSETKQLFKVMNLPFTLTSRGILSLRGLPLPSSSKFLVYYELEVISYLLIAYPSLLEYMSTQSLVLVDCRDLILFDSDRDHLAYFLTLLAERGTLWCLLTDYDGWRIRGCELFTDYESFITNYPA